MKYRISFTFVFSLRHYLYFYSLKRVNFDRYFTILTGGEFPGFQIIPDIKDVRLSSKTYTASGQNIYDFRTKGVQLPGKTYTTFKKRCRPFYVIRGT